MKADIEITETRKIVNFSQDSYPGLVALGKYNYNKAEDSLADHVHENMIEICYYDKGSQWFFVGDNRFLVKGGEVFVHFPGEVHGSGGNPEAKGRLYWFIIEVSSKKNHRDDRAMKEIGYLCSALIDQGERHFMGKREMKQILEEVFITYHRAGHQPLGIIRINMLVQRFLLLLLDCIERKRTGPDERLTNVLNYIDEHISTNISLACLADLSCLSESRFKNLFKEQTGFTPGDYIQRVRIQRALEMINNDPGITISQVANQLNFSSPQYLSSVIKKYTGTTPGSLKRHSFTGEPYG